MKTTNESTVIENEITPKERELLEFVKGTQNLHIHLTEVAGFCLLWGTEHKGLSVSMCDHLYFVTQLAALTNFTTK